MKENIAVNYAFRLTYIGNYDKGMYADKLISMFQITFKYCINKISLK